MLLRPIISTLCAMQPMEDKIRISDGNGLVIMQRDILVLVRAWRDVMVVSMGAEGLKGTGHVHSNERVLYEFLVKEISDYPGPACIEVLRKASTSDQHSQWESYGHGWTVYISKQQSGFAKPNIHKEATPAPRMHPEDIHFPMALVSLPTKTLKMIASHVESLRDQTSLRETNTLFRTFINPPAYETLELYRASGNVNARLWHTCVECCRLLHIDNFNSYLDDMLENCAIALCLECGSKPFPQEDIILGLRWNEERRMRDRIFHFSTDLYPGKRSQRWFYGPGFRWRDRKGKLWLRCENYDCLTATVNNTVNAIWCDKCVTAGNTYFEDLVCFECRIVQPWQLHDQTRNLVPIGRDARVCLPCGTRDLPQRYNPCSDEAEDRIYNATEEEVAGQCTTAGQRYGMQYIWTDAHRRTWKRCRSCRKAEQIKEMDKRGECKMCREERILEG